MTKLRKTIAALLAVVMILPYGSFAYGAKLDYADHWAKNEIEYLMYKDIVTGYTDGSFRPDNRITRAEFVTIANYIFGYSELGQVSFRDVNVGDWFYNEIAKAVKAGYISGYSDNTMRPNNSVTRQEASVIIGRIFSMEEKQEAATEFKDVSKIGSWAKGFVNALNEKGYISGYPDRTFRPENSLTRAEAVKMLANISGNIINSGKEHTSDANGNVVVSSSGTLLRNMHIKGNLYLAEGIGKGEVTLDNVTVEGNTYVRGGGENSITIKNSKVGEVVVEKSSENVSVVLDGETIVDSIRVKTKAKIEVKEKASVDVIEINSEGVEIIGRNNVNRIINNK